MKMFSVAVMSAAVLTGLAGAGVAYEIASSGDSAAATSSTSTTSATPAKQRKRFAPCEPPADLQGKACVTDVVRTVVVSGARLGVASARDPGADDGRLHDAFDDHGDDGPLHDAFDDHGDDGLLHDAFDDHDDDFDDDHSGHDDSDDPDDDSDDDDHSGHGGGDDSRDDD